MLVGDLMTIANNDRFQRRVDFYIQKAALNVMAEDPATPNHADRITYAKSVMLFRPNIHQIAIRVLTNPTIGQEANLALDPDFGIADGDIEFQINSIYDALAGATK